MNYNEKNSFLQNLRFYLERKECNDKEKKIKEQLKIFFEVKLGGSQIEKSEEAIIEKSKEALIESQIEEEAIIEKSKEAQIEESKDLEMEETENKKIHYLCQESLKDFNVKHQIFLENTKNFTLTQENEFLMKNLFSSTCNYYPICNTCLTKKILKKLK
jgi:hypothetical protein